MKRKAYGTLSVLLLAGIVISWQSLAKDQQRAKTEDDSAFQHAEVTGTEKAYRDYLTANPSGGHAREAGSRMDDLTFRKAVKANSKPGYRMYLSSWPRGKHAAEATKKLTALDNRISSLRRRIEKAKKRLSEMKAELKPMESRLDQYRLKIKEFENSRTPAPGDSSTGGREQHFNMDIYNSTVKNYNALLAEYQPEYEQYKQLLDKTNTDVTRINLAMGTK
ncbi:hypothetical protein ACFL5K_02730 [Gemmatimonadota bacterium]